MSPLLSPTTLRSSSQVQAAGLIRAFDLAGGSKNDVFLGDPTLRLHVLAPPAGLAGVRTDSTTVNLSWPASSETGASYLICRGTDETTPFTTVLALVAQTNYVDTTASVANKGYLVRTARRQLTGSGSYTNLSQGVVKRIE